MCHDLWMIVKTGTPRATRLGLLAAAGGMVLLAGCAETSVWAWSPASGDTGHPGAQRPAMIAPNDAARGGGEPVGEGVVVFGRSAFVSDDAPEAYRRDGLLAARSPEALPDRLGWPEAPRPDLSRTGSLRTSTQAERWVYPQTRRDHAHRRYPVYPPYRGW